MPSKNKPKHMDRNRSWRVARRKRKINEWTSGKGRTRKKRPKHKNQGIASSEIPKEEAKE
jgi:hypothetical protein